MSTKTQTETALDWIEDLDRQAEATREHARAEAVRAVELTFTDIDAPGQVMTAGRILVTKAQAREVYAELLAIVARYPRAEGD